MTRILAPFTELGYSKIAEDKPYHRQLLTPEYMHKFEAALQTKFPDTELKVYESGMASIKGRYFSSMLTIYPNLNLTFDVKLNGSIEDDMGRVFRPFVVTKTVFPDDDPAELADWVYIETQRKMKSVEMELKQKYPS
jgi:hypothetical protein